MHDARFATLLDVQVDQGVDCLWHGASGCPWRAWGYMVECTCTCDGTGCRGWDTKHDARASLLKNVYALPPRERLWRRGKAKPLEVSQILGSWLQAALETTTSHQWEDQARRLLVEAMAQQR